jgi:uncharacterized protein YoxC
MPIQDITSIIGCILFAILIAFLALPLIKLSKTFDQTAKSIDELTNHTVELVDETSEFVKTSNKQLNNIDNITTNISKITDNILAVVELYTSVIGKPVKNIKKFLDKFGGKIPNMPKMPKNASEAFDFAKSFVGKATKKDKK